jgi:hypothetical protein
MIATTLPSWPAAIAGAIEVPHGAVVETLLEHGITVYSLNPKQLDRFRDRHHRRGWLNARGDHWLKPRGD